MKDYKGYGIIFEEDSGLFKGYSYDEQHRGLRDNVAESTTLKGLYSKLDELSKMKFNIQVFVVEETENEIKLER